MIEGQVEISDIISKRKFQSVSSLIGVHLIEELLESEVFDRVYYLLPEKSKRGGLVKSIIAKYRGKSNTKMIEASGTLFDIETLQLGIPENCDCVFHIISSKEDIPKRLRDDEEILLKGTKNLINSSLEKNVERFVMVTSHEVYLPRNYTHEKQFVRITETSEKKGKDSENDLIRSQYLCEKYLHKICEEESESFHGCILQPGHIMGEYNTQEGDEWQEFFLRIKDRNLKRISDGVRSIVDVKRLCKAIISAYQIKKDNEDEDELSKRVCEEYVIGGTNVNFRQLSEIVTGYYEMEELQAVSYCEMYTIGCFFEAVTTAQRVVCCYRTDEELLYRNISRRSAKVLFSKIYLGNEKAVNELGYVVPDLESTVERILKWMDQNEQENKRD